MNFIFARNILRLLWLISLSGYAFSADDDVDTTFDLNLNGSVVSSVMQSDGKILIRGGFTSVAGVASNGLARLNGDGTLDTSFTPDTNRVFGSSIAIQTDNKILINSLCRDIFPVGGRCVRRLNSDGTLDTSFNLTEFGPIADIAIQSDGKILVAGTPYVNDVALLDIEIARLHSDGTLDTGFNTTVDDAFSAQGVITIAIQPDDKILIGGFFTSINGIARNYFARLNSDGTLDTGFNPNVGESVYSIAIQSNGKILIGGFFTSVGGVPRNNVARLNSNGTLDTSFENPMVNGIPIVSPIAVQSSGKVLIGGRFSSINGVVRNGVARLNNNGTLDLSFNLNQNGSVTTFAFQPDGKILIGGNFSNVGGIVRNNIARLINVEETCIPIKSKSGGVATICL